MYGVVKNVTDRWDRKLEGIKSLSLRFYHCLVTKICSEEQ